MTHGLYNLAYITYSSSMSISNCAKFKLVDKLSTYVNDIPPSIHTQLNVSELENKYILQG